MPGQANFVLACQTMARPSLAILRMSFDEAVDSLGVGEPKLRGNDEFTLIFVSLFQIRPISCSTLA